MTGEQNPKKQNPKGSEREARRDRLSAALRENLKRRKAQARSRRPAKTAEIEPDLLKSARIASDDGKG